MSCNLTWQGLQRSRTVFWEKGLFISEYIKIQIVVLKHYISVQWMPSIREFTNFFRRKSSLDENSSSGGLNANIPLPSTGEEAMHRLLACKGRDPYSILGKFRFSRFLQLV